MRSVLAFFWGTYLWGASYTIPIHTPQFQPVTLGFLVSKIHGTQDYPHKLGEKALQELERLLLFTRIFQVEKRSQVSFPKWQALGVQGVLGLEILNKGLYWQMEIRCFDVAEGRLIFGRQYSLSREEDLEGFLKNYVDGLFTLYTGRRGIFSYPIVFIGRPHEKSERQVYLCDPDGRRVRPLTKDFRFPHLSPSWSQDGQRILFTSIRDNPNLYMMDMKTEKTTLISGVRGNNSGGVFAPGGALVVFTGSVKLDSDLFSVNLNFLKSPRKALTHHKGIDVDPSFSPDGQTLAYVSDRFGNPHIFRSRIRWNQDGSGMELMEPQRLTYSGWYNANPAWSPNGEKIAFAGFDREIQRFDIFLMNADGTALERLTLQSGSNEHPSWSPSGHLIMFHSTRQKFGSSAHGRAQLYIMGKDGSGQTLIPTGLWEALAPSWSQGIMTSEFVTS